MKNRYQLNRKMLLLYEVKCEEEKKLWESQVVKEARRRWNAG